MILAFDLGNSRMKWAAHPADLPVAGRFTACGSIAIRDIDALEAALAPIEGVHHAVVCSVAGSQAGQALERAIVRRGIVLHQVHARAACAGVVNLYEEPARLGADRWVALVGARARTDAASLVVDAGTAMTVDALAADGRFLGGLIVPGFDLMRSALAQGTARLPLEEGDYRPLARSTRDAITTGALQALAGAVLRTREAMIEGGHEAPGLLLTGGSAPRLASVLGSHTPLLVPDLVLEGLVTIAISDACLGNGGGR
jgi:type III pantothenate kinase